MWFTFRLTVTDVFERKLQKHVRGAGADAVFESNSAGWYLQFGNFSVYVGTDQPTVSVGDQVTMTLSREKENA